MSRISTLALAASLSLSQLTPDELSAFYDEAIYTLAAFPELLEVALLDIDISTGGLITLPDPYITILQLHYGPRTLDLMSHDQLQALSPSWQDTIGTPLAYTQEHYNAQHFRLYPQPSLPTTALPFTPGGPFGPGFPPYNVTVLATTFQENIPIWLELPLALSLLHRAYTQSSAHHDPLFAQGCFQVMQLLISMLKLPGVF